MVLARIRKVGNSLVVTVPKEAVAELDLREGDLVLLELRKAEVRPVLRPELRRHAEESWAQNQQGYRYLAGR